MTRDDAIIEALTQTLVLIRNEIQDNPAPSLAKIAHVADRAHNLPRLLNHLQSWDTLTADEQNFVEGIQEQCWGKRHG